VSYSWTLKGERKLVPYENPQGRRANAISVYLPFGRQASNEQLLGQPELWWDVVPRTLRAQDVLLILEAIPRGKGALVVVLDNASIHISHKIKEARSALRHKGIQLYHLPPYSPQLNLIEPFLGVVKYTEMPERSYPTMPSLLTAIDQAFTRCEQRLHNQTQHQLRLAA
jgi:transposase InsO family protein